MEGTEAQLAPDSPVFRWQSWNMSPSLHSGAWFFLFLPLREEEGPGQQWGKSFENEKAVWSLFLELCPICLVPEARLRGLHSVQ